MKRKKEGEEQLRKKFREVDGQVDGRKSSEGHKVKKGRGKVWCGKATKGEQRAEKRQGKLKLSQAK